MRPRSRRRPRRAHRAGGRATHRSGAAPRSPSPSPDSRTRCPVRAACAARSGCAGGSAARQSSCTLVTKPGVPARQPVFDLSVRSIVLLEDDDLAASLGKNPGGHRPGDRCAHDRHVMYGRGDVGHGSQNDSTPTSHRHAGDGRTRDLASRRVARSTARQAEVSRRAVRPSGNRNTERRLVSIARSSSASGCSRTLRIR